MADWNRFKAKEGVETIIIAGEVFKIRKSLKARKLREILNKHTNDVQAIQKELIKAIVVDPVPPEDFDELWDEMDASIQAELIAKAMEISGLNKLFRLAME